MYGFDDLKKKSAAVTGASGVIGVTLATALCRAGAQVIILDYKPERGAATAAAIAENTGCRNVSAVEADVTDRESLLRARDEIREICGTPDILVNCAGGNRAAASTAKEFISFREEELKGTFFDLDIEAFGAVNDLNFRGTVLPTMILAEEMVKRGSGVILNVSSMNAFRPLTRIPAYSASKAAVNNFTAWLAVHLAPAGVRVNAIAPGFLLTSQNRFLLLDEKSGEATPRGRKIISATPMGRYAEPEELVGTVLYLVSEMSSFVTGVVVPVDGGFSAYSGV